MAECSGISENMLKEDEPLLYVVKYFPVQSLLVYKDDALGVKKMPSFSGTSCAHGAFVINDFGALEYIGGRVLRDTETIVIPAQPGLYAAIEETPLDGERYIIGYLCKNHIPSIEYGQFGEKRENVFDNDQVLGKKPVKACAECGYVYGVYHPPFCVKCGSDRVIPRAVRPK